MGEEFLEGLAGEGEGGGGGDGFDGVFPGGWVVGGEGVVAVVVAVCEDAEDGVVAVFAGADFVDFAVGDEDEVVGGLAGFGDDVAGFVVVLGEAVGECFEDGVVVEVA